MSYHDAPGRRSKLLALLLALTLVVSTLAVGPAGANGEDVDFWLTVLHNNDGESDVFPDEVLDDGDNIIGFEKGVAYFATTLNEARTAANKKTRITSERMKICRV